MQCLFYNKITESEGLDTSEGTDIICTGVASSEQCDFCHFCFSKTQTLNISPMFAIDFIALPYVLNR